MNRDCALGAVSKGAITQKKALEAGREVALSCRQAWKGNVKGNESRTTSEKLAMLSDKMAHSHTHTHLHGREGATFLLKVDRCTMGGLTFVPGY